MLRNTRSIAFSRVQVTRLHFRSLFTQGGYTAYNVTTKLQILNRVYQLGFPLWAGLPNATQAALILQQLQVCEWWGLMMMRLLDKWLVVVVAAVMVLMMPVGDPRMDSICQCAISR